MGNLRICFCGPNVALNESLVKVTKDLVYADAGEVVEIPDPTQQVGEITRRDKFEGAEVDWLNMWATSLRRMMVEGARDAEVVLSASCGIDQVCIQAAWLGQQVEASQTALSLVDARGNPLLGEEGVMVNRSGAVLQSILNSTEQEVYDWWGFTYAVLPASIGVSSAPEQVLTQYQDLLSSVPAFQGVTRLPDNEEAAVDALKNEVGKWKEVLSSQ